MQLQLGMGFHRHLHPISNTLTHTKMENTMEDTNTIALNEALSEKVQEYPVAYNKKHKDHKDKLVIKTVHEVS